MAKTKGKKNPITSEMKSKILACASNYLTVTETAFFLGIDAQTLKNHIASHIDFKGEWEAARKKVTIKSKMNVTTAINDGDLQTSKWFLEKTENEQFAGRIVQEEQGPTIREDELGE